MAFPWNLTVYCHLLITDLFLPRATADAPDPYQSLSLPALQSLLGRASQDTRACDGQEGWLCQQFGVPKQHDWPVACLTLVADGVEPDGGYWLRADPVHLHVARDQLVLVGPAAFPLRQEEADQLTHSLNQHFATDGLTFIAPHPDRWYLRLDRPVDLETTPLGKAAGRHVDPSLPRGSDSLHWHALLNEIQMLLFSHPVNEARESVGQLPVNSIWLWGGGQMPEQIQSPFQQTWADDLLAQGLAIAAAAPLSGRPASAGDWLSATVTPGAHLIVLDTLQDAAQYGDTASWQQGMQQLEQDWFAPLLAALRQKRLQQLILHAVSATACRRFTISKDDLWKFWRRSRPLAAWAPAADSAAANTR